MGIHCHLELLTMKTLRIALILLVASLAMAEAKPKYEAEERARDGMCFVDRPQRLLKHRRDLGQSNSPMKCRKYCKERGYKYAGVQATSECFCGYYPPSEKFLARQQSECNSQCPRDKGFMCGGAWRMNVYRAN